MNPSSQNAVVDDIRELNPEAGVYLLQGLTAKGRLGYYIGESGNLHSRLGTHRGSSINRGEWFVDDPRMVVLRTVADPSLRRRHEGLFIAAAEGLGLQLLNNLTFSGFEAEKQTLRKAVALLNPAESAVALSTKEESGSHQGDCKKTRVTILRDECTAVLTSNVARCWKLTHSEKNRNLYDLSLFGVSPTTIKKIISSLRSEAAAEGVAS